MFKKNDKIYIIDKAGKKKFGVIIKDEFNESGKRFYYCDFNTMIVKLSEQLVNKD